MTRFFFSGSELVKADGTGRFVVPQQMRFGLIEEGKLEFTIALGFGGCLAIYRTSEIEKVVESFRNKSHLAHYQKFFTLFFSTLHQTSCDEKGRVLLPPLLKSAIGLKEKGECELVLAGVLNRIEIWPAERYRESVDKFLKSEESFNEVTKLFEEALTVASREDGIGI